MRLHDLPSRTIIPLLLILLCPLFAMLMAYIGTALHSSFAALFSFRRDEGFFRLVDDLVSGFFGTKPLGSNGLTPFSPQSHHSQPVLTK